MVVTGDTQLQDEDAGVHHKQLPKVASESDTSTDSAPIKSYQPSHEDKEAQAAQQERVRSAVWRHDVFNLVALAVINMMNCYFLASRTGTHHLYFLPFATCVNTLRSLSCMMHIPGLRVVSYRAIAAALSSTI